MMNTAMTRIYTNLHATIEKALQKTGLQFGEALGLNDADRKFVQDDFIKIQRRLFDASRICKDRLRPMKKAD